MLAASSYEGQSSQVRCITQIQVCPETTTAAGPEPESSRTDSTQLCWTLKYVNNYWAYLTHTRREKTSTVKTEKMNHVNKMSSFLIGWHRKSMLERQADRHVPHCEHLIIYRTWSHQETQGSVNLWPSAASKHSVMTSEHEAQEHVGSALGSAWNPHLQVTAPSHRKEAPGVATMVQQLCQRYSSSPVRHTDY